MTHPLSKPGLAIGAATLALATAAHAQEPVSEQWQFEVGPALWATAASGYLRPSPAAPVAHFNDSFGNMRLNAASFSMDAGRGRWGVLANLAGIGQSRDSDPLRHGEPGRTKPDGTYSIAQLAGAYRLSSDPDTHFDLVAGVRFSSLDIDVTQPQSVAPFSCVKCSHNEHWTDGIAGFRVEHRLDRDLWITTYADYGGGGSNSTWQALLGASWRIDEDMNLKFGYRILSTDFRKTQLMYNLKTGGLYAGLGMRF